MQISYTGIEIILVLLPIFMTAMVKIEIGWCKL